MAKALSFDLNYSGFNSLAPDMFITFFDHFCVIELIAPNLVGLFTNSSMMIFYVIGIIGWLFKGGKLIPHR